MRCVSRASSSLWLMTCVLAASACTESPGGPSAGASGQGGQVTSAGSAGMSGAAVAGSSGGAVGGAGGSTGGSSAGGGGAGGAGGTAGAGGGGGAAGGSARFKCPDGPFPAPDPGDPQQVCQAFDFPYGFNEGPTWVGGAFYFSNFVQGAPNGNTSGDIIKYTPGGDCAVFIEGTGTNGLAAGNNGNLLGASHKTRSVTEFDIVTKQPKVLADMYMNELLDSPNDLVQHSNGTIYFTNPTYELGGRDEGVGPAIFRRDPAGMLSIIKQGMPQPNGIALSPEEDRLYVVNGPLWDLDENGVPTTPGNYPVQADGMGVDCAGNVYMSGGTIRNRAGDEVGQFSGGTNLAFGGPDGKTLFVVGGDTDVKVMQTNVPGLP